MERKISESAKITAQIPKFIVKILSRHNASEIIAKYVPVDGTFLFMDISGFTSLSENLSRFGREGTEILTQQISSYFEIALESFFEYGGDVVKFGGDALTIFFEKSVDEAISNNILRACKSSLVALNSLQGYIVKTPFGDFELKAKIGISFGSNSFLLLGEEDNRLEYIFSGVSVDCSAEAEHNAKPLEIVFDKDTFLKVENLCNASKVSENFLKLISLNSEPKIINQEKLDEVDVQRLKNFIIPSVYGQIKAGGEKLLSDHRPVIPCFVSFPSFELESEKGCEIIQKYFLKIIELLKGFGGSFNRMDTGDKGSKFLCFFGAPETYADNEERAVAFSLELKKLEKEITQIKGQSIGITSGIAYCGLVGSPIRQEYTIMGDVVNVSARLMTLAKGTILVSDEVREKTKKKFKYSAKKKISLKGKSYEISVSTPLKTISKKIDFFESKQAIFVGREDEISKLKSLLKRSSNEIVVSGEAGIGKSELIRNVIQDIGFGKYSFSFINIPFSLSSTYYVAQNIIEIVFKKIGIDASKIGVYEDFFPDKIDFLPLLNLIFGRTVKENRVTKSLSAEQRVETLAEIYSELLDKTSQKLTEKLVVVVEDFYRISNEDKEFLSKVLERLSSSRINFVFVSRKNEKLSQKSKIVFLNGFSKHEVELYAKKFLKNSSVPLDLVEFLYERSSGNPFYLKEILSMLKEKKIVSLSRDNFVIFNPQEAYSLSRSLEEIILMRIDSLQSIEKNLLKIASCFGEFFETDKLSNIFVPKLTENEIREKFSKMNYLGIVKNSERGFQFSKNLLRDTLYNSILVSNKRNIHRQIGELFEKEKKKEEYSETLSFHFGVGEVYDKAFDYSLIAARRAYLQQLYFKAQKFYSLSIEYGEKIGKKIEEIELLNYLKSLIATSEYDRAEKIIEILRKSDDFDINLKSQYYFITILDNKGEYEREFNESTKLIEKAQEEGRSEIIVLAFKYAISALIRLGKYDDALKWTEDGLKKILEYNREEELPDFYILIGSALYSKGDYKKAANYYSIAEEYAEETKNYEVAIRSYYGLANCHLAVKEPEKALEYGEKALEIAKKLGSRINILGAGTTIALCLIESQREEQALEILKSLISLAENTKVSYSILSFYNQLGLIYYNSKEILIALKYFKKTLSIAKMLNNIQGIIFNTYNISDIFREIGQKERAKKGLLKIIKNYADSTDINFLKRIGKEFLELAKDEKEKQKFFKILINCANRLKNSNLFDEIIKNN
ncbi:MAG: tetratricopeptide repeat protein [Thermoanaerobaculaceae bacterium]|nr:tetratricopeptide repeat protein [Thermoanaerobaculaceae bacterium]